MKVKILEIIFVLALLVAAALFAWRMSFPLHKSAQPPPAHMAQNVFIKVCMAVKAGHVRRA